MVMESDIITVYSFLREESIVKSLVYSVQYCGLRSIWL